MNNKGFAITTILYGTLILFCLLMVSMLGILSAYRNNLKMLVENHNGTRDILVINKQMVDSFDEVEKRGLYCLNSDNTCMYIGVDEDTGELVFTPKDIDGSGVTLNDDHSGEIGLQPVNPIIPAIR